MVVPNEDVENQGNPEQTEADRVKLLTDTVGRLDVFNKANAVVSGDEPDDGPEDKPVEDELIEDEPSDKPEDKPVEKPEDKKPDNEDESKDEPEDGLEAVKPDDKAGEPTLPAAYRRSLIASEWTEEEIDGAFANNPDGTLKFAEKVHRTRNAETARFADAGRRTREEAAIPAKAVVETSQADAGLMKPVDVDAMVKEYGNEELVRALSAPVNAAIEQINAMIPQVQQGVQSAQRTRQETLAAQIEGFFADEGLKPYETIYGQASTAPLTEIQQTNRHKVLEAADAIVIGAQMQGRQLTVEQAMMMAHDSIASDFKAEVIRKDLKTKTKKRAKGVSLKPSHRGRSASSGRPTTRKQLEQRVGEGLSKVFS